MASESNPDKAGPPANKPGERPQLPPLRSSRPVGGGGASPPVKPVTQPASTPSTQQLKPDAKPSAPSAVVQPTKEKQEPAQAVAARQVQPAVRKPKQDRAPEDDQGIWRMSRLNFLNVAGWFAFFSFLATATVGAIRLMVPRVLYEPPSAFKAGFPEEYVIGEVNEKYKDEFRVWIVREQDGFYALAAICTHLGCTPRWSLSENKFKCPCHGSGYHKDGINFEGPTPRPLERLKITIADDGQILVDRNIKFLYEKQEWIKPDSYLKYG